MITKISGDFISHQLWFQNVISEDVILCGVSALEFLGMFTGYIDESAIDVYAKSKGIYDNINYILTDSFENIEYVQFGNVRCTTFGQTVNDMLRDLDNADEAALTEALGNYYFDHNESFAGLKINSENLNNFNQIKDCAISFYCGG